MRKFRIRQAGLTLMEMLVAMVISLVVALAMVGVMANTLGSGTTTIEMTRLGAELRQALQIMSRDVRRANYHGNFAHCFANIDCRTSLDNGGGDASSYIKPVTVVGGSCFFYWFDRNSDRIVANSGDDQDPVGAFKLGARSNGAGDVVGTIEMTTSLDLAGTGSPNCTPNSLANWTPITDPNVVDVTAFVVDNAQSYTDTISGGATQRIDKIRMRITGVLVADNTINRTVEDVIRVRNDIYTPAP